MSKRDRIEKYANGRPTFEWPSGMTEHAVDEDFIAAVAQEIIKTYPGLYSFDGELKQLKKSEKGIYLTSFAGLDKRVLIKDAVYIHEGAEGDYAAITSPRVWFKNAVFDEVVRQVPSCAGIVAHPIMTPSGEAVSKRGYNPETGIYVDTSPEMEELCVHTAFSQESIALLREILEYMYSHKTFYSPADKSRYIAVLLTAVMSPCYDIAPPLYANNATTGSVEARTLFYELDKTLHGRVMSQAYLGLSKYIVQRKNMLCMRDGKNLPIFLAHSDENQTPNWRPCYIASGVSVQVLFDDSRDKTIKEIAKEFESFRVDMFQSLFDLIQAWHQAGKPAPTTPSAFDPAFDEWYYHVAGVLEHAGYTSISEDLTV